MMNEQYVDLNVISVDKSLSVDKRKEAFLKQIHNPYCYLCDGITVHIEYGSNGETLEKILVDFLISKK